jgi:hypothetical protein
MVLQEIGSLNNDWVNGIWAWLHWEERIDMGNGS